MKVDEFYVDYETQNVWQVLCIEDDCVTLWRRLDGTFRIVDLITFKRKFSYSALHTNIFYDHNDMLVDRTTVVPSLVNHILNHYKDVYSKNNFDHVGLYVSSLGCFAEVYSTRIRFINNALSSPMVNYKGDYLPLNTTFIIKCKDDIIRAKALLQIAYRWVKKRRG